MERPILVPLSLLPVPDPTLSVIREQAGAQEAPVLLLHVLAAGSFLPAEVTSAEATARAFLDSVALRLRAGEVEVHVALRQGQPAPVILDVARELRARLVVMGATTRARLPRALLGSTADAVVRDPPCPVLLVRPAPSRDRDHPLLTIDDLDLLVPRDLGVRTVDVARIVGSATRAHELGADFRPLRPQPQDEARYQAVLTGYVRGDDIPPVELYKVGFGYYVRDGHHRVAAARRLGRAELAARVTELVPLEDLKAERAFAARLAFERDTGLTRVGAQHAETYERLAEAIAAYERETGCDDHGEAARRWYGEIFRPMWRRVRELGLALHFPGERPADIIARIFVWQERRGERDAATDWPAVCARFAADVASGGAR